MSKILSEPKKTLFVIIICFLINLINAQFFLSPQELYAEGEEFIFAEEFNEALPSFKQIYDKGYNTANVHYKIGTCYLFSPGKKENAISHLEKAVLKASSKYSGNTPAEDLAPLQSLYYLGIAYRINNQFEKSSKILNILKDSLPDNSELLRLVNNELKICDNAQELIIAEINLKTNMLDNNVNTAFSNYNPVVNSNETLIYYMSSLKFYDAISQSIKTDGNWTQSENLTSTLKSDGDYLVVDMSDDENTLLLFLYDSYTRGDIFICENKNGKWDKIKKLNSNINTPFNETHASFANNGNTIYFTSNRPGGFGGLDIYKSDKDKNGEWGTAVNLGHVINTSQNEETPYLTADGKILYFSSQGHYNMGGYDIFMAHLKDNGEWSNPANIGYPLNTTDDDIFYFPLKDGSIGYHAKFDDNLAGRMDIYRYEVLSRANPARFTVKGQINLTDDITYPYELIKIALVDKNSNDTVNSRQADKDGKYLYKLPSGEFELNFYTNHLFLDKKSISLPEYLTLDEMIINTELNGLLLTDLDKQKPLTPVAEKSSPFDIIDHTVTQMDTFILKNILFGFDRVSITASYSAYLREIAGLLEKYPGITIRLIGHTDAIGDELYNKILSEKRANQVKNYLISFNIEKTRITASGYGEESPAAINNNPDGSDNPQGRFYNRRVEFVVEGRPDNLIITDYSEIPAELSVSK